MQEYLWDFSLDGLSEELLDELPRHTKEISSKTPEMEKHLEELLHEFPEKLPEVLSRVLSVVPPSGIFLGNLLDEPLAEFLEKLLVEPPGET